jgi:major intracellular serine protease
MTMKRMMKQMSQAKLIPFKIESVDKRIKEIPYGVKQCEAPKLWKKGEKGEGIVVAVLDTGVDTTHPDLVDRIIGGRNFTNEGSSDDYSDRNGHGTHVAGTIAASETNSGVIGVAPMAKLLICKVLDGNGSGDYGGIIEGIRYATNWIGENGERVRVMNMSLGGSQNDSEFEKAILEACAKGIVIVVASGNEGDDDESTLEFGFPACYNECVTVAACDENKELAYFSNNNLQVDCIAAGVSVNSTYLNGEYARLSGTSMATPHVTGAVALIINSGEKMFRRGLSESEIYALLVKCSNSLGYEPSSEGHGLIKLGNMYKKRRN